MSNPHGIEKRIINDTDGCAKPRYVLYDKHGAEHLFDHVVDAVEGLSRLGLLKQKPQPKTEGAEV